MYSTKIRYVTKIGVTSFQTKKEKLRICRRGIFQLVNKADRGILIRQTLKINACANSEFLTVIFLLFQERLLTLTNFC